MKNFVIKKEKVEVIIEETSVLSGKDKIILKTLSKYGSELLQANIAEQDFLNQRFLER